MMESFLSCIIPSWLALALTVLVLVLGAASSGLDYHSLPNETLFPGPWEDFIKAPADKAYIVPARIWQAEGDVTSTRYGYTAADGRQQSGDEVVIAKGGLVTFEFDENISGRVCFDVKAAAGKPRLRITYSESHLFVDRVTDATNDEPFDLPLDLEIGNNTGPMCVGQDYVRGAFKFLTLFIDHKPEAEDEMTGAMSTDSIMAWITGMAQKVVSLGDRSGSTARPIVEEGDRKKAWVNVCRVWVQCTSFPSQVNGRAYSGYLYSSSSLLNQIWYAGAYTLQLSTLDPRQGSALIAVNRVSDGNRSPPSSWYSNFTVSHGTAVTTDGAKRDRLVWPGDMYIAIPGIAVSTYDMLAVRNALDIIVEHQFDDGGLPYAGPPISQARSFSDTYHMHALLGVYDYVLYSGDVNWLRSNWRRFVRAVKVSSDKVDGTKLMAVTSALDWNRHGMAGHNIEANGILHALLKRSIDLAHFLKEDESGWHSSAVRLGEDLDGPDELDELDGLVRSWHSLRDRLEQGVEALYCEHTALYSDNLGEGHCNGSHHVDPQDGNSWALIAAMQRPGSPIPLVASHALRSRWNAFGAPAIEFPNVMSPFSSGFELQAHCEAGHHDAAVELMLLMWGYLLNGPGFTNSTLAEGFRTDGSVHYPAYPGHSRNSHAHGWSAGPTSVLMTRILGITLLKPLGREWIVRPVLTKWLAWIRGGFAVGGGEFEVSLKRVRDDTEGRKGVVAVVSGPAGTLGRFGWGDDDTADDESSFETPMVGAETRAWARWEPLSPTEPAVTEELDAWGTRRDRRWYEERIPYGVDGELVFDDSWTEPGMVEREPGVVNFTVMENLYLTTALKGAGGEPAI